MTTATLDRGAPNWSMDPATPDVGVRLASWRGANWLTWWTWGLLALGIVWRLTRYFLQFPISGDEPLFGFSLVNRDFAHVFQPLENCAVAPSLFVLVEWVAFHYLGASELAMRLVPELAGLLSLLVFKRIAEKLLSPLAAAFAVGLLAVSYSTVKMSSYVKPYSLDLFGALVLLWLAVKYLECPRQSRWLWVLAGAAPLVMLFSFPALFIVAAIGLGLLASVWRNRSANIVVAFANFGLTCLGTFAIHYFICIARTPETTTNSLQQEWGFAFPPSGVMSSLTWFLSMITGDMFAYPLGQGPGAGTLTALLFSVGLWQFTREKRGNLVCMSLAPFALGLAAAFLHRYPFGGAYRVYQHVVPFIMLGVGAGLVVLLKWRLPDIGRRKQWATGIFTVLAVIGVIGLVRDCVRSPGRDIEWARAVGQCISRSVQPDDLVVFGQASQGNAVLGWYLLPVRDRMLPLEKVTDADLARVNGDVWLLYCDNLENARGQRVPTQALPAVQAFQHRMADSWFLTDAAPYLHVGTGRDAGLRYCLTYRWCKSESTPTANLPAWPRD